MVLIKVCLVEEVPPRSVRAFNILDRTVLLANMEGRFYAMDGLCSHQTANLALGTMEGYIITCPRHGAQFDIRTGKAVRGPVPSGKIYDLRSYRVEMAEGCLLVDI